MHSLQYNADFSLDYSSKEPECICMIILRWHFKADGSACLENVSIIFLQPSASIESLRMRITDSNTHFVSVSRPDLDDGVQI